MNWLRQIYIKIFEEKTPISVDTGLDLEGSYKVPKHPLQFKRTNLPTIGSGFTRGYDGAFYIVHSDDLVLRKYDEIISETPESVEGMTWDNGLYGGISRIIVLSDGIVVFTSHTSSDDKQTVRVYRLNDMFDDNPTLIYQSNGDQDFISGSNQFGVKYVDTGLNTIILAGVYGRGDYAKDLILSTDGGRSFKVIKQTKAEAEGMNSHWHDVAIDTYHGYLWASEGDSTNSSVHFSDDLGETWRTLNAGNWYRHPTAVVPFPNKMLFGRDKGGTNPGFDTFDKPDVAEDLELSEDSFKPLREFRTDTNAGMYYATGALQDGQEAYFSFDTSKTPKMIAGTGDGGNSIHFLHFGAGGAVNHLREIDDKYIYGETGGTIVYAERPVWVDQ